MNGLWGCTKDGRHYRSDVPAPILRRLSAIFALRKASARLRAYAKQVVCARYSRDAARGNGSCVRARRSREAKALQLRASGSYWARELGKSDLRAFQASRRGGEIRCRLTGERINLEGDCVFYLEGTAEV